MFFRWLHKSWKYFWGVVLTLLLICVILAGGVLGVLQLDATQNYLADRLEQQVENSYHADLAIGELNGFLPFRISLQDVVLRSTIDSSSADTIASVQQVDSQIDLWGLIQNKVTITGFSAQKPRIWIRSDIEGRRPFLIPRTEKKGSSQLFPGRPWLNQVEVIAPTMEVADGTIFFESTTSENKIGNLPRTFALNNIQASFFVDWSEQQRYLDIESFSAKTENLTIDKLSFSGQVYSDQHNLEFNSFYVNLDKSRFILNGEIVGVNLVEPNFTDQLLEARYNLGLRSNQLYPEDLRDLFPRMPSNKSLVTVDIEAQGTMDSLQVNYASMGMGESQVTLDGLFKNLGDRNDFSYDIKLNELVLRKDGINQLIDSLAVSQYMALESLNASGRASGSLDSLNVDLQFESPLGNLSLKGQGQLKEPFSYSGSMSGDKVDVGPVMPAVFDTTSLSFTANMKGAGFTLGKAISEVSASISKSHINNVSFGLVELKASLDKGLLNSEYDYRSGEEQFSGSLKADLRKSSSSLAVRGSAENINLAKFFGPETIASTNLNFEYNVNLQNLDPARIYGRTNLDILPSIVGGDSVRPHQIYMDLNSPEAQKRTFRLTSSLFDMEVNGKIVPSDIMEQARFWTSYLSHQFHTELLLDSTATRSLPSSVPQNPVVLEGSITTKDLTLIQNYFPDFPGIQSDSEISFSANTDGTRLLLSAKLQADTLNYNQLKFSNSRTQMTASFRSDRKLKGFSTIDMEASVGALNTPSLDMDSLSFDMALKQDSVYFIQKVGSISDNARFRMAVKSSLSDSSVSVSVEDFFLGNQQYSWTNETRPSFTYHQNGAIKFENFSFQNRNEYLRVQGTLSKNRADSLTYILRDISLGRISELVKGDINFSGVLNGTLVTRSLMRQPTIQGALDVNRFRLNDRIIGDVSFNSRYSPEQERFNTDIDIVTDTTKYKNYLESNDGVRQNIHLDGYFVTPDPEVKQDTVFYFDADFDQIDMWVIRLITENIFQEMEGKASGKGYVTGNLEDFDFHANFQVKNVFVKPRFVNTNYFLSGPVVFDRQDGVVLDSVNVMDTKGGKGVVWGTIDLNDFKPITYLDLTLDMDRLQFLNNSMDPDVPFFGNVSGSGVVRLTGANNDLYMRTESPVRITNNSNISIPLMEETELKETGKFIRFVDSFKQEPAKKADRKSTTAEQKQMNEEQLEQTIEGMTFSERFDLDLQFDAPQNVTVNLIFDPVTGEILTAEGTGQIRINMQDQDVQMFGRYNINSGSYQFVTGEIISRKLQLEPGGTIIWEGPPDNARLDISAVYNARPNISTLTSDATLKSQNRNGGQRVPIELIVEINGTLNSVENNYYFRLPSSLDLSSNSTLSYTINQINRDEQQKLLQATSILFTGQFIPTQGTGSTTASLSQSLTRGATVLNPLLSNQVISPLLSNQINALLNSDVSRLDVDFNLNAYNEVDLGIALRLYNDRLILRREGQITGGGPQSSLSERIGDINATYRIQRGLSLTAFHRQDQVLSSLGGTGSGAGDVTPSVDGIGLESQIRYNSWKELIGRIKDMFNRIFGINDKKEK